MAVAITAWVFVREAHQASMFGVSVWWILVPLWAVLIVSLVIMRRAKPKA